MFRFLLAVPLSLLISNFSWAGNGVERGVVVSGVVQFEVPEVSQFLIKQLANCKLGQGLETFNIKSVQQTRDRVDQGIIDIYYSIELEHLSTDGQILNSLSMEILDSDFSNWRNYEEKLSVNLIKDQNNFCKK